MNGIADLPLELGEQILLRLSYDDIINYCNVHDSPLCTDSSFWKRKARLEDIPENLIDDLAPQQRYRQLLRYGECLKARKLHSGYDLVKCFRQAIMNNDLAFIRYLIVEGIIPWEGSDTNELTVDIESIDELVEAFRFSVIKSKEEISLYLYENISNILKTSDNFGQFLNSGHLNVFVDSYVEAHLKGLNRLVRRLELDPYIYQILTAYVNDDRYLDIVKILDVISIDDQTLNGLITLTRNLRGDSYDILDYLLDKRTTL